MAIFRFNGPPLLKLHQKGYNDVTHSRALECNVWTQLMIQVWQKLENLLTEN